MMESAFQKIRVMMVTILPILPEALPDIEPAGTDHSPLGTRVSTTAFLPGHSNGGRSAKKKRRKKNTLISQRSPSV